MKNKNNSKIEKKTLISLIIVLSIEIILLFLIFLVLLVALAGVLLPILPGILFLGLATAIYTLMVKGGYNRISGRAHSHLFKFLNKIFEIKIIKKIMNFTNINKKEEKQARANILKYGLILLGLNLSLALVFCFSFIFISILSILAEVQGLLIVFVPLIIIFIFAGSCGVLWYRFGQILGGVFPQRRILNSLLTVLVSFLPLMSLILIFAGIIGVLGNAASETLVILFLGFLLMSVFSGTFELLVVSLGTITAAK